MKPIFLLMALTVALTQGAQAVELNKEAMKTMQQEGERLVEESKGGRTYRAGNNLCLDAGEGALMLRKCNAKAKSQKWITDAQSRLVAHDGRCLAGTNLAKCTEGKPQKWKLDGKKRLANANKQCLQAPNNQPKAGAKLVTTPCNKGGGQVWK